MTRMVFASCMSPLASDSQKVWKEAIAHEPDWLILAGDNIYMDYFPHLNQSRGWTLAEFATEMERRYSLQFAVPSFRKIVESVPAGQVIGVWDDHDFAWNDCFGAEPTYGMPEKKKVATALYHHYFAQLNQRPLAKALPPLAMPDLTNPPNGELEIYRALDIAPFRVLLVDGRTWRGKHPPKTMAGDLLGEKQEKWLFDELARSGGPFLLITGSTMTAGDDQGWDYYQDFFLKRFLPATRGKLMLFLAGDVHENRLPPRVDDHPVEIVSSAAVLDFPFNKRNFGVLDVQDNEARVFLYKRGEVQYASRINLGTGKYKTTMAALKNAAAAPTNTRVATAQRSAAMRKLKSA